MGSNPGPGKPRPADREAGPGRLGNPKLPGRSVVSPHDVTPTAAMDWHYRQHLGPRPTARSHPDCSPTTAGTPERCQPMAPPLSITVPSAPGDAAAVAGLALLAAHAYGPAGRAVKIVL
jgi:hypothetical protein